MSRLAIYKGLTTLGPEGLLKPNQEGSDLNYYKRKARTHITEENISVIVTLFAGKNNQINDNNLKSILDGLNELPRKQHILLSNSMHDNFILHVPGDNQEKAEKIAKELNKRASNDIGFFYKREFDYYQNETKTITLFMGVGTSIKGKAKKVNKQFEHFFFDGEENCFIKTIKNHVLKLNTSEKKTRMLKKLKILGEKYKKTGVYGSDFEAIADSLQVCLSFYNLAGNLYTTIGNKKRAVTTIKMIIQGTSHIEPYDKNYIWDPKNCKEISRDEFKKIVKNLKEGIVIDKNIIATDNQVYKIKSMPGIENFNKFKKAIKMDKYSYCLPTSRMIVQDMFLSTKYLGSIYPYEEETPEEEELIKIEHEGEQIEVMKNIMHIDGKKFYTQVTKNKFTKYGPTFTSNPHYCNIFKPEDVEKYLQIPGRSTIVDISYNNALVKEKCELLKMFDEDPNNFEDPQTYTHDMLRFLWGEGVRFRIIKIALGKYIPFNNKLWEKYNMFDKIEGVSNYARFVGIMGKQYHIKEVNIYCSDKNADYIINSFGDVNAIKFPSQIPGITFITFKMVEANRNFTTHFTNWILDGGFINMYQELKKVNNPDIVRVAADAFFIIRRQKYLKNNFFRDMMREKPAEPFQRHKTNKYLSDYQFNMSLTGEGKDTKKRYANVNELNTLFSENYTGEVHGPFKDAIFSEFDPRFLPGVTIVNGGGGAGKTTTLLRYFGPSCLYVAKSNKRAAEGAKIKTILTDKEKEREQKKKKKEGEKAEIINNCYKCSVSKLIGTFKTKVKYFDENPYLPAVIIDEYTQLTQEEINLILKECKNIPFVIFVGDECQKTCLDEKTKIPGRVVEFSGDFRSINKETAELKEDLRSIKTLKECVKMVADKCKKIHISELSKKYEYDNYIITFNRNILPGLPDYLGNPIKLTEMTKRKQNDRFLVVGSSSSKIHNGTILYNKPSSITEKRNAFTLQQVQGDTIEKGKIFIIMDGIRCKGSFYVAVSRCVDLNQIVLVFGTVPTWREINKKKDVKGYLKEFMDANNIEFSDLTPSQLSAWFREFPEDKEELKNTIIDEEETLKMLDVLNSVIPDIEEDTLNIV